MAFARHVMVVTAKDLRAEFRTKEAINASFAFAIVMLTIFSFAFDPDSESTKEISGGLLWIVFAFAGALLLNRSFARELPNDCLDGLIAAPISRAALFLGKSLANYLLAFAVEMIALPVFGIFYDVRWTRQFWPLMMVLALGTWAITLIGGFVSALTVNVRLREVMLPMLTYPLLVPALMSSMELTSGLLAGQPITADQFSWVKMLVGFDAAFTTASLVFVETVLVG